MQYGLPFIHGYSAQVQLGVLLVLILASYFSRPARFTIGGLTSAYLAFKILVPVVGWMIFLFKGFAMCAFYIYFFKIGVGYVVSTVDYVFSDGITALIQTLETANAGANANAGRQDGHD